MCGLSLLHVVKELANIKQLRLISLVGTYVVPQVQFQEIVDPLGLSIDLRVETDREVKPRTHKLGQLHPKITP